MPPAMVPAATMTIHWSVPLGESRAVTDALHRLMLEARQRHGCLGCSLATEASRRAEVHYREDWASEESLQEELRSERFSSLASLMESSSAAPTIEFRLPDGTRGLEYAHQVRRAEAL